MYKILTLLILLDTCLMHAQESWCGSKVYSDPSQKIFYQNFLQAAQTIEENNPIRTRAKRYIPVVIHVVARDGFNPVTQAQALQQLDVLNNDFAAMGDNIGKLLDEFKPLVAPADIHFCLATVDPSGQPTTGITFRATTEEYIGTEIDGSTGRRKIQYDVFGGTDAWDATRYINIWVGECLNILGSATMPGTANFEEEIGIIIDIHHFGAFGDAGYYNEFDRGHTLTHEMGHFLGLKHIWGNGNSVDCSDSDDIDDTPNQAGPYYGCPQGEQISCELNDMYQNFMDLTNDRCLAAFTHDQVARMNNTLDLVYPDLISSTSCNPAVASFDEWFDELAWSTDAMNHKIIVYHPVGSHSNKDIRVFSTDGKLVFEKEWNDDRSMLINLNGVAAGVYIVNITMGDECRSRKIVMY
jgi:hypothetical protein